MIPVDKLFGIDWLLRHVRTLSTDVKHSWIEVGSNAACDTSAGEVYLQKSPGKLSNLQQCKQLCEDDADCQSITYFKNGWCSHFSTPCSATTSWEFATALRLTSSPALKPIQNPGRLSDCFILGSSLRLATSLYLLLVLMAACMQLAIRVRG